MLKHWLTPVSKSETDHSFFNLTYSESNFEAVELDNIDCALIGFNTAICNQVRSYLNGFHNHFRNIRIADLGNCRKTEAEFILPVIDELINTGVIPVLVGADINLASILSKKTGQSIKVIANNIPDELNISNGNLSYIGYQRHLIAYDVMSTLDEKCNNALSLGKLRSNINLLEPLMRDTTLAYIHLNSVRSSDAPGVGTSYPSGLTTEEMCQIMKFAGTADTLKIVAIDTDTLTSSHVTDSKLIAEAIWYLFEGMNARIADHPEKTKDYHEFLVSLPEIDTDISFVKSTLTNKWWMKLPDQSTNEVMYIACAYEEYQQSISGTEIPDRLMKFLL
jgi:hypothetical protein